MRRWNTGAPEEKGVPAQLHECYLPSEEQKQASEIPYHGEAAVDVIFVHGLGSKFETTWAHKRPDGSRYHWLEEQFPKDMPDARVLVYEYPSRWYDDPVQTDLDECAHQLLRNLIRDRRHDSNPTLCRSRRLRPIIFVGHSFGGLVIKMAMAMASQINNHNARRAKYENYRDILAAISGVIFLGTPHRGSSFSWLGGIKSLFGKYFLSVQSNDEIINILTPDSFTLRDVQRQFAAACQDDRLSNLKLVCYYEMRNVGPLKTMVVHPDSAVLDNAAARGMDANHMDMNAFYHGDEGRTDNNYDHFISDVRMLFHDGRNNVPKRFDCWVYGSSAPDADRERLLRALNPSREAQQTTLTRYLDIYQTAPYTCQWIHAVPQFQAWRTRQGNAASNTTWIRGHGGAGKSVLAAYVIHSIEKDNAMGREKGPDGQLKDMSACSNPITSHLCGAQRKSAPILYFFCGMDRNSETTERMLGTLIHQLLLARGENQELFEIASKRFSNSASSSSRELAETLAEMAALVGDLYIVIDNLEDMMHSKENENTDNPEKFLGWLALLRPNRDVHILISSQETPEMVNAVSEHFQVDEPIDITLYTAEDIHKFTQARGETLFTKKPVLREKEQTIMQSLHTRAQGSFQWVNSAFEHLKYVEDVQDVEPQLEDIERDLLASYDRTFERLGADHSELIQRRIVICLKLLTVSATPVTSADVKIAWLIQELIDGGKSHDERAFHALFDRKTCEERTAVATVDIRNYVSSIIDLCSDGTLQFKHQSYLKALTRPGPSTRSGAARFKFSLQDAHQTLAHICMSVCRFTAFVHANSFAEWRPPLVQYAWNFWAYHFKKSNVSLMTVEDAALQKSSAGSIAHLDLETHHRAAFQATFNKMVDGATRDALQYIEALMDFISRPLQAVPGRFSDREYVLSLQRAQESLIQPAKDLCVLRRSLFDPISSRLQHARQSVDVVSEFPVPKRSMSVLHNEALDKLSGAKSKLLGARSAVSKLRVDEYLASNTSLPRPWGSPQLLLEIARSLRIIALRFAVDPIYSALLATASGSSFSPLHPLVYLAQLFEEGGLYPYWDALPPGRDLMESFVCPDTDPEYASAKFVLHCFEWRDPHVDESAPYGGQKQGKTSGYYVRTTPISIDIRPLPSGHGLTRVSTENFEQVRRLHQVKGEQFMMAQNIYAMFSSNNELVQTLVTNPLTNMHMQNSLLTNESGALFEDPNRSMARNIPEEVQETPLRTMIRAMPLLIRTHIIHYVVMLLESCGQLARHAVASHFSRIQWSITEIRNALQVFRRVYDPGELPPLRLIYFVPAALLFFLRCRYFPWWGSYYWYHAWGQFSWAWKHPAAYVDLQKEFGGWWQFIFRILRNLMIEFLGNFALITTTQKVWMDTPAGPGLFTWSIFHLFCLIDRSLFSFATAAATLLACGKVMFADMDSLTQMLEFSMTFWIFTFFNIVMTAVRLGALEQGGGAVGLVLTCVLHLGLLYLLCRNITGVLGLGYWILSPAKGLVFWSFRVVFRASVFAAQMAGIAALFYISYKAFMMMHRFVWDPYDIKDSLKTLLQTSEMVHQTLAPGGKHQYKRIGWYPLGEKEVKTLAEGKTVVATAFAEAGPPRARVPAEAAMSATYVGVTETTEESMGGVRRFFEGGGEGVTIQRRVDAAVLAVGDSVGRAVDGVGPQVDKVMQSASEAARKLHEKLGDHLKQE